MKQIWQNNRAISFVLTLIPLALVTSACSSGEKTNEGVIPQSSVESSVNIPVSNKWDISTIRSKGNSGTVSDMFLDANGEWHLAFADSSAQTELLYGYKGNMPDDIWVFSPFHTFAGVSEYLSMGVESGGDIRVAFADGNNLMFARRPDASSAFNIVTVDGSPQAGFNASYATVGNTYAIAYQRCFLDCSALFEFFSRRLMVATSSDGVNWQSEEVEFIDPNQPLSSRGHGAKAFANEAGNLSVVSYNSESFKLSVFDHSGAYGVQANWNETVIENTGSFIDDTSVAIDPNTGFTAIAYFDDVDQVLKVATREQLGAPFEVQIADASGNVGTDNSIAIRESDGALGVSYYDLDNEGLRFVFRNADGEWQDPELIANENDAGRATTIVFTPEGIPVISYYQRVFGDLEEARRKKAP